MNFKIDKQTLDELNLLGRFQKDSVYNLFNHVKTAGGALLFDQMFNNPLTDVDAINKRCHIFQFFQSEKIQFHFDGAIVKTMDEYIDSSSNSNKLMVFATMFTKKMLASLTRDDRYKKALAGLQAVIITLDKCHKFVQSIPDTAHPFQEDLNKMKVIFSNSLILKLCSIDIYQPITVGTLAYYDHLLKGILHSEMSSILSFIYEVDVYVAVSGVATRKNFSYGKALPASENIFQASDLRHPCLQNAIGNSITMNAGSNVLFLTGANMAGKSTLMKSIGICMYLAHMGFPVAANGLEFNVRDGLYSSINVADNIGLGYSHFYAEVVRVKQAAEATANGQRLLLLFDELFKGTNVKDAYEGTLAVTQGFAAYHSSLFVVSTHIIEVGEALKDLPNVRFVYMPTVMDENRPRYTYRLEQGITEDRQGMLIIKNEGIFELLSNSGVSS
ncbi:MULTISPECIES: MutS-related protein [unclassified Sphingobacterium]|uniref:MutS-related protein n=1 Tax=unclassified Sphingobacterium TaxID=2609468 RepID=UPI00104796FE|nr:MULTISPECIES: DNA mismatch repair protein [unclassified Sphingobacterium]MCS3556561.1 DNA mismatch repair ATPase MutS [Sphingobacterium sp. JUb21]TCQ99857.1 MutS-like protein [Sphingobacterium sp. JUb20]